MIEHNLVILTPRPSIQTCWSHNSMSVSKETLNISLCPHRRCGGLRLYPNPITRCCVCTNLSRIAVSEGGKFSSAAIPSRSKPTATAKKKGFCKLKSGLRLVSSDNATSQPACLKDLLNRLEAYSKNTDTEMTAFQCKALSRDSGQSGCVLLQTEDVEEGSIPQWST